MGMSFNAYIHAQIYYEVSPRIRYISDEGYCVFAYDEYRQRPGASRSGTQVDVLIMEKITGECSSELWVVEAKDFRQLTAEPRATNTTGLPQTLKRKFEDSHAWLQSQECPEIIREQYNKTAARHFCTHIELPLKSEADKVSPRLYNILVSVFRGLSESRMRFITPDHSPLVLLNSKIINADERLPWRCQA